MGIDRAKWIACFTFGLCLVSNLYAQSSGQTVRHHKVQEQGEVPAELTQAEAAIEKRDYSTAEPLLKKVVSDDPHNFQAWFDLGFVYHGLGNDAESIAAYRKSVAAKPDVFESNLNLGLVLAKNGSPDADQFLRAATTLKPTANVDEGRARAWLSLAHLLETTKPDDAIAAYQKAAALTPKDPEPHLSAGGLLETQSKFADAEQEYKSALALDPSSADALTGLANIYMRGHRYPEASDALHKLLALRPDDASAHLQLGRLLDAEGKSDEALAQLQAGAKAAPNDPELRRELADLYVEAKQYDQADALYRALVAANPKDAALRRAYGAALIKEKKFPDAQQQLLAAVQLNPKLADAYGDLAIAADENKDYALAIRATDARAQLLPEVPASYFLRATAYDHLRDYKKAAENYHKFLEVADGKFPDQEWQARHRLVAIEPKK